MKDKVSIHVRIEDISKGWVNSNMLIACMFNSYGANSYGANAPVEGW